jgi:hypothetical protein
MERNVGVQFMCWTNVMTAGNELMFRRKTEKHWELPCRVFYTDIVLFLFVVCITTMQIANTTWPWEDLFQEYFRFCSPLSVVFYHCLIILLSTHRRLNKRVSRDCRSIRHSKKMSVESTDPVMTIVAF